MKWIVGLKPEDINMLLEKKKIRASSRVSTMTIQEDPSLVIWDFADKKNKENRKQKTSERYEIKDELFHDCNDGVEEHGGYMHFTLMQILMPTVNRMNHLKQLDTMFKESILYGYNNENVDGRPSNEEGGSNVPIAINCIALMAIKLWQLFISINENSGIFTVSLVLLIIKYSNNLSFLTYISAFKVGFGLGEEILSYMAYFYIRFKESMNLQTAQQQVHFGGCEINSFCTEHVQKMLLGHPLLSKIFNDGSCNMTADLQTEDLFKLKSLKAPYHIVITTALINKSSVFKILHLCLTKEGGPSKYFIMDGISNGLLLVEFIVWVNSILV
jgi:hypothetical protein